VRGTLLARISAPFHLEHHTMAHSSLTGIESAPVEPPGRDVDLLGPSDSSDSGSDSVGSPEGDSTTDAAGTGERRSVAHQTEPRDGQDIGVDRVFSAESGAYADDNAESVDGDEDESEDPDLALIDQTPADDAQDDDAKDDEDEASTDAPTRRA